jgi:DNA-binding MarR family transcriptional regulator
VNDTDLAAAVHVSLGRIVRALRQEASGAQVGAGGISALVTLDVHGPKRVGALAEVEGVTAPSMTRIVNVLEGDGLVTREPDPLDGRAQVVAITAAGSVLLASGKEAKLAALERRVATLPDADRARLLAALPALERLGGVTTSVG